MIVSFTDFGTEGPYLGQLRVELLRRAPHVPVIDLMADAPRCDPRSAAYLLAALVSRTPENSVIIGVVDPGVGTDRAPVVIRAGGRWLVGPDNGLFERVVQDEPNVQTWVIVWRPPGLSASFHGRDLFAPVAARLASGEEPAPDWLEPTESSDRGWPQDLPQVIYVDHYGNCMSGIRACTLSDDAAVATGGRVLKMARTFGAVDRGKAFWYRNSLDLVEIAVNGDSAAEQLGLQVSSPLSAIRD